MTNPAVSSTRGFLTGCAVTVLVVAFFGFGREREALAEDAITKGKYAYVTAGNTLYVIETGAQYMAAYRAEANSLRLLGGRSFQFDLPAKALTWYERRDKELTPENMKDLIDRALQEKERQDRRKK